MVVVVVVDQLKLKFAGGKIKTIELEIDINHCKKNF